MKALATSNIISELEVWWLINWLVYNDLLSLQCTRIFVFVTSCNLMGTTVYCDYKLIKQMRQLQSFPLLLLLQMIDFGLLGKDRELDEYFNRIRALPVNPKG